MTDPFAWWLLILGIGIGIGLLWLVIGRIPREQDDVSAEERAAEAAWISGVIGRYGGVAPEPLVEEILELHDQYLKGPALEPAAADVFGPADQSMERSQPAGRSQPAERSRTAGSGEPAERSEPAASFEDEPTQPDQADQVERAGGSGAPDGDGRAPARAPTARTARPT
jgi:hypothetical protein